MVPARPRMEMEEYTDRRILVFGLARSGQAAARLLLGAGAEVRGADENDRAVVPEDLSAMETRLGPFNAGLLDGIDGIVVSPGVGSGHPLFEEAAKRKVPVIGELELAFRFARAPVVAVTGTNGKSTTVAMIGAMLAEDGREVFVAGNTGTPFSSVVADAGEAGAVEHVFADGAGQGQGQGKDHAHPSPQRVDIGSRGVNVRPVQQNPPRHLRALDKVVQPVDQPQQRRLAPARRAKEDGDGVGGNVQRHLAQGGLGAVGVTDVLDVYLGHHHCLRRRK